MEDTNTYIEKLLYQFKESSEINNLMKSILREVLEVNESFIDLLENRNINTGQGAQLDQIGYIVGEDRNGRNDEDYRKALELRIRLNNISGTCPEIEDFLMALLEPHFIQLFFHYPASVCIYIKNKTIPEEIILTYLQETLPAGVNIGHIAYYSEEESTIGEEFHYERLDFFVLSDSTNLTLSNGTDFLVNTSNTDVKEVYVIEEELDAFVPYDEAYKENFFVLSNGSFFELSDQTLLTVRSPTEPDYIQEAYLAESPEDETQALFSRLIENI